MDKKDSGAKINNFKFLIELSITQFSEFFNFELIEKFTGFAVHSVALAKDVAANYFSSLKLKFCVLRNSHAKLLRKEMCLR